MARKVNPEEERLPSQPTPETPIRQASWFNKIDEQRDAIFRLSPELSAWFGEQFTARLDLWEWRVTGAGDE